MSTATLEFSVSEGFPFSGPLASWFLSVWPSDTMLPGGVGPDVASPAAKAVVVVDGVPTV